MKLTASRLRGLIGQVIKENRMNLVEERIGMSFEDFREILKDRPRHLIPGPKHRIHGLGNKVTEITFK